MKILAIMLFLITSTGSLAVEIPSMLSYKSGSALGRLSKPANDIETARDISYGGVIAAIEYLKPVSNKFGISASVHSIIDPAIGQVTRQGIETGLFFNLWGGTPWSELETPTVNIAYKKGSGLNLFTRTGMHFYGISSKENTSQNIAGSILQNTWGLELRFIRFYGIVMALEYSRLVTGVPSSTDRLSASGVQTLVSATMDL